MHLQENTLFDLYLRIKVTQIDAQYPLHHAFYAPSKFAVATSNSLGDAFTKIHDLTIDLNLGLEVIRSVAKYTVHFTSCGLYTCKD